MELRRGLLSKLQIQLIQQQSKFPLRLDVAAQDDFSATRRWKVDVEHLEGCELLQHRTRCQPNRTIPKPRFERPLQAKRQKRNGDVRVAPPFELVVNRSQRQLALELLKGLWHRSRRCRIERSLTDLEALGPKR